MPLREKIFLIGYIKHQITGSKLPSKGDCLKVLMYNLRMAKLNLNESAALVTDECLVFWRKARIPTQEPHKCKEKLKKLYEEWRSLSKNMKKNSEYLKKKENVFLDKLDDLFDIAHQNALDQIKIEEDRLFLSKQREKGRPGSMLGIDRKLAGVEKRKLSREEKIKMRHENYLRTPSTSSAIMVCSDFDDSDSDMEIEFENEGQIPNIGEEIIGVKSKRARKEILTPRLAAVFDKCKISERDAVHLLIAFLEAASLDPAEYVVNRTSVRKARAKYRETYNQQVSENFLNLKIDTATLHWDTKLLSNITGKKIDRLAVIATSHQTDKLLGVPEIPAGTGVEISSAVYELINNWGLTNHIQAFVFDTTASNTGKFKGACSLLERKIERDILFFGCRHHIYEIILSTVFTICKVSPISGPDIPLFKKFKSQWDTLKITEFSTGISHCSVQDILKNGIDVILQFCLNRLNVAFPRDDYKEFLVLIIIFLGGVPPGGIKFKKPGAYHLARWMSKGIYSLKIFLFRNQFKLTKQEENSLVELNCFIVKCYAMYWFTASNCEMAPLNDIQFLRKLHEYSEINKTISEATIGKFVNHLYYLNEECSTFALFDRRVCSETKLLIAKKIIEDSKEEEGEDETEDDETPKKLVLKKSEIPLFLNDDDNTILINLVGRKSQKVFKRFKINSDFLKAHPNNWSSSNDYKIGEDIIHKLKVVNDAAERGIKLIEEFEQKVTRDENQKQFLLQTIQDYRQKYHKPTLNILKNSF